MHFAFQRGFKFVFVMTALQTARAELRDLAMNLVLSDLSYLTRLGCRLVGPLQSMTAQVAAKKGHRKLMRLVHPDKNNGSAKSELATKELQKLLEVAQWIGPLAWHSLQLRPLHPMETAFLAQEALVQRLAEAGCQSFDALCWPALSGAGFASEFEPRGLVLLFFRPNKPVPARLPRALLRLVRPSVEPIKDVKCIKPC